MRSNLTPPCVPPLLFVREKRGDYKVEYNRGAVRNGLIVIGKPRCGDASTLIDRGDPSTALGMTATMGKVILLARGKPRLDKSTDHCPWEAAVRRCELCKARARRPPRAYNDVREQGGAHATPQNDVYTKRESGSERNVNKKTRPIYGTSALTRDTTQLHGGKPRRLITDTTMSSFCNGKAPSSAT